jgi:two-component system response regulator RegA
MSMTWLLVEDDATFRGVLARALERRGHAILQAANTAAALDLAGRTAVTRVVLDLKLGADSGLALIEPLLALQPALKIVVLTGYASIPTAVEAIRRGAHNYLCKPVDIEAVLAAFETESALAVADATASPMSLRRLEWEHIQRVLAEHAGNISSAARALGMHRRTLQRRLAKRPVKD